MHTLTCHHKPMQHQVNGCCRRQCTSRVERGPKACSSIMKRDFAVIQTGCSCYKSVTVAKWPVYVVQAGMQNSNTGSSQSSRRADSIHSKNPGRCPVLILPGFLSNNTTSQQSQYRELANNLLTLGHPAAGVMIVEQLPAQTATSQAV